MVPQMKIWKLLDVLQEFGLQQIKLFSGVKLLLIKFRVSLCQAFELKILDLQFLTYYIVITIRFAVRFLH